MKIEITISSLAILDTIVSGIDGGIHYWARVVSFWIPSRTGSAQITGVMSDTQTDLHLACDLIDRESDQHIMGSSP